MLRFLIPLVFAALACFGFASNAPLSTPSDCHSGYTYPEGDGTVEVVMYAPACAHNPTGHDGWTETGTFINATGTPCHGYTKVWLVFGWVKYTWYSADCPHKPKPKPPTPAPHSSNSESAMMMEHEGPPLAPFATVASVVSQTRERPEPWRPCGEEPTSGHCVCVTLTWLCGGEEHAVTYRLCSICDVNAVKAIMVQAQAFGCTLISRQVVACQ